MKLRDKVIWLANFLDSILMGHSASHAAAYASRQVRADHLALLRAQHQRDNHY